MDQGNPRSSNLWTRFLLLLVLGFLFIAFAPFAKAGDPWDTADKSLGAAALVLHIADWGQTRYIAKHQESFRELNPFLGEHPSVGRVNSFFILTGIASYFVADYFKGQDRKIFLTIVTVAKAGTVIHNHQIGVKVEF